MRWRVPIMLASLTPLASACAAPNQTRGRVDGKVITREPSQCLFVHAEMDRRCFPTLRDRAPTCGNGVTGIPIDTDT